MERLKQELELAESIRSYKYHRCISFLDFLFGLLSLQLTSMKTNEESKMDEEEHIYSRLKVSILGRSNESYPRSIWRRTWVRLLFFVVIMYIFIKFSIVAVLQISYERIIGKLMPETCFVINGTDCCLQKDANMKLERHQVFLNKLTNWIDSTGYPLAFFPVMAPYLICIESVFLIAAYPVNLTCISMSKVYLDIMGFIHNPVATARRHYRELDRITLDLSKSFLRSTVEKQFTTRMKYLPNTVTGTRTSMLENLMEASHQNSGSYSIKPTSKRSSISNPNKLVCLLHQASRRIQPVNLDAVWHKNILEISHAATKVNFLFLLTFSLLFYFSYVYIVLDWNIMRDIEESKCSIYGENARPIIYLHLRPLNLSSFDQQQGQFDQPNSAGFGGSLLDYFTFRRVLMILELTLSITLCNAWFSLFVSLFFLGMADKVRWIKQIRLQIMEAIEEQAKEELDHERLLNLTISAYLNYALFKSEYPRFKPMANIALIQVLVLTVCAVISLYLISEKNFKLNNVGRSFVNTSLILLFGSSNVIFSMGSYLFAEVEHTIKQLIRLMTFYNNIPRPKDPETEVSLDFIMDCWQRHLLDKESLGKAYALSLIGMKVCFEKLLPMNAYTLAVALMMMK